VLLDAMHWLKRLNEGLDEHASLFSAFKKAMRDALLQPDSDALQRCRDIVKRKSAAALSPDELDTKAIAWGLEHGVLPRRIHSPEVLLPRCGHTPC
jgi:hypothetical protein